MASNNTGNATASLVVGIVALAGSWIFSWTWFSVVLGVVAIALAASAFKDCPAGRPGHGMAVAGLVLGILAVAFSGLLAVCVCGGLSVALFPLSCMACVL